MLRLLRIEWMKVKNYRTFWILLAITLFSIPGVNYMFYNIMNNSFPKVKGKSILGSPFGFPDAWQTVSWNSSLLFIIPAILIITLTTNEFTYKTHRQNVIDGWSRGQFVGVKLIEVLLLSILTTITVFVTAFLFGYLNNKGGLGAGVGGVNAGAAAVSVWQESRFVFFYFVEMLSYSLIAFLLAMLIKRAGLALGLFFIYLIVEQIVVGIFRNIYKVDAVNYLPEEVTDRLVPLPYAKAILSQQDASKWESHIPVYLLVAFLYLVIYCLVTGRQFLKSDL
jgi:ABC-2 type transport system permease protein